MEMNDESTSIRPVDVGTGTREENVAPDKGIKPFGGYMMRLSTMRFVKKEVVIARSLE
jgi:hypothetical protein